MDTNATRADPKAALQAIIKTSIRGLTTTQAAKAMNSSKDFARRVKREGDSPDYSTNYYIDVLLTLGHEVTLLVREPEQSKVARLRVARWV